MKYKCILYFIFLPPLSLYSLFLDLHHLKTKTKIKKATQTSTTCDTYSQKTQQIVTLQEQLTGKSEAIQKLKLEILKLKGQM